MKTTVVGLYDDFADAQRAANDLEAAGFTHNDVSIVSNNADSRFGSHGGSHDASHSTGAAGVSVGRGIKGAVGGAVEGGVIGGLTGLAASLALLLIPGIGPVAALGPLAATLSGASIGATGGGIIGALAGLGIPKEEAGYYAEGVRRGGTLVSVRADESRADEAARILDRYNPVDIDHRGAYYRSSGYTDHADTMPHYTPEQITSDRASYNTYANSNPLPSYNTTTTETTTTTAPAMAAPATNLNTASTQTVESGDRIAVPVVEEQLVVGKREVERGRARIRTYVTERPVEEQVTLREEHVHVERHAVNRPVTDADAAFREGTIEVRERAEEAVVAKNARVVEEVVIEKQATQHTETVRDTVRRTDVDVDEDMNANLRTSGTTVGVGTTGTTDTRSVTEKASDALTGDRVDDKTGKVVR